MINDDAERAMAISQKIQTELYGLGPMVQGAILADLVSIYFAGHHPSLREQFIKSWLDTMYKLIPASEQQIKERYGGKLPDGWE